MFPAVAIVICSTILVWGVEGLIYPPPTHALNVDVTAANSDLAALKLPKSVAFPVDCIVTKSIIS